MYVNKKETIIGIVVTVILLGVIAALTGVYGIFYIGLAFVIAIISIQLFSQKSVVAKISAAVINTDLIYKILMPSKYKKAIKELEENEINKDS